MSKPRYWWLAKSVSDDDDTMTAYDIDGEDEDWGATKGIYVVEKSAADKLAEALEFIWRLEDPQNRDLCYEDTMESQGEVAEKALKEYQGEE